MSTVEVLGAILCVFYLLLAERRDRRCWYPYIASSILYAYIFWSTELPLNAALQFFFVAMGIRGLRSWTTLKQNVPPRHLTNRERALVGAVTAGGTILLASLVGISLRNLGDGFVTAGSLVATYLTEQQIRDSWLCWIAINGVGTILFASQGLPATSVLYLLFAYLALRCYRTWEKA